MLTAFLPCRKGSQRIPDKNIKPFAGAKNGLLEIKLEQLLASRIDNILLSSNDERVLVYASSLQESRIEIVERPDVLSSSETSTDQLIEYVPSIIEEGDVLWTHVTSPFINAKDYNQFIDEYSLAKKDGYDSLMSVKKLQTFLWDGVKEVNYDRSIEKWPRTQNIKPLFEVDSGVFISSIENYIKLNDRIGLKPKLCIQEGLKTFDIDWPEDFELAQHIRCALLRQQQMT